MAQRKTLLLVDAGAETLEDLSARLRGLGHRVVRAKTVDAGLAALSDRRFEIGAVMVPPDLPTLDLERALHAFRRMEPDAPLPLLAVGPRPDADHRAHLRRAGVAWALWRPVDDSTLRFQTNRALAGEEVPRASRRAERVPANWPVQIGVGQRQKAGLVYSLSARGAYLSTERPSMPRALVHVALPLPQGDVRVAGQVVMTNVPGNLVRQNLPLGMGVRFTGHGDADEEAILAYVDRRAESLRV
jgi:CheY-like chemotaxis protein